MIITKDVCINAFNQLFEIKSQVKGVTLNYVELTDEEKANIVKLYEFVDERYFSDFDFVSFFNKMIEQELTDKVTVKDFAIFCAQHSDDIIKKLKELSNAVDSCMNKKLD